MYLQGEEYVFFRFFLNLVTGAARRASRPAGKTEQAFQTIVAGKRRNGLDQEIVCASPPGLGDEAHGVL